MTDLVQRDGATRELRRPRDDGPTMEALIFSLAGELYAAKVGGIHEILRPPPLTRVPRAPRGVLGVVSVRGRLVTVVDPRRALSLASPPPTSSRARIVLVETADGELLGVYVDEVQRVERFADDDLEPPAASLGSDVPTYVIGIARPKHRRGPGSDATADTIVLLDLSLLIGAILAETS